MFDMKRFIVAIVAVLFLGTNSFAGDKGIVEELKKRTLIIQLLTEDAKVVRKHEKDLAFLAKYRKNIKESNEYLKYAVEKYWKYSNKKLYKTKAQIEQLKEVEGEKKKRDRKNYVVLSINFFSERYKTREESAPSTNERYTGDATYLFLRFWEGQEILYTSFPHVIPTKGDFVYALRTIYHQVVGMEYGKDLTDLCKENGPQVRDKVLLLTETQVSEIRTKDIIKAYKYPYKVVSEKEIEKAVVTADPKFAVIISADQSDTVVMKNLILTGSGKMAGYFVDVKRPPFSKKDLKELMKFCK